jgi:hypothetical protein
MRWQLFDMDREKFMSSREQFRDIMGLIIRFMSDYAYFTARWPTSLEPHQSHFIRRTRYYAINREAPGRSK